MYSIYVPEFEPFNKFINQYKTKDEFSENLTLAKILHVRRGRNNYTFVLGDDPYAKAEETSLKDAMVIEFAIKEKEGINYLQEYGEVQYEGMFALLSYNVQCEEFMFHAFLTDIKHISLSNMLQDKLFTVSYRYTQVQFAELPEKEKVPSWLNVRNALGSLLRWIRLSKRSAQEYYEDGRVADETSVILPSSKTGMVQ